MSYTVPAVAEIVGCSPSFIHSLVKKGKLKAVQEGPKKHWTISNTQAEMKSIVSAESKRRIGYKKNGAKKIVIKVKPKVGEKFATLYQWVSIADDTRDILMQLAEKYNNAELELLLSL